MKVTLRVLLLALFAALCLALAACGDDDDGDGGNGGADNGGDAAATAEEGPIVIGAAIDQSELMQFFDGPALAAAQIRAEEINAEGGVNGRQIEFRVQNTRLDPERTRSAALELVEGGADIMWVTCDVDWATPAVQVGLQEQMLTVAPCIGTDQMGPKRFGEAGKLAFSFGNVAQDEGAAIAKVADQEGWESAIVVADQSIAYTQNVCQAFTNAFEAQGGNIVAQEQFTEGDGTIRRVISRVNQADADTIVLCATTQEDLPAFVSGVRTGGTDTPIIGSWSIDGAFWLPQSPNVSTNIHVLTHASVYGDDPDERVGALMEKMTEGGGDPPATGGFVTGAAAIDAIVEAIKQNDGSTDGAALAETMEGFKDLDTSSGPISFSPEFHTVFGREYRHVVVTDGKPAFKELVKADAPAEL